MPFPLLLALGAAAGLGKSIAIDAPRANRERKLAAETQRYSPWTGLKPGGISEPDPFGSALSFGLTGFQLDQGEKIGNLNQKLLQKAIDAPNNPVATVSAGGGGMMGLSGAGSAGNPYSVFGAGGAPGGGNYNFGSQVGGGWPY